jgi:hypothetical protein
MDGYFHKVAQNAQIRADLGRQVEVVPVQTSHAPYCYKQLENQGEIRLIKFDNFSPSLQSTLLHLGKRQIHLVVL